LRGALRLFETAKTAKLPKVREKAWESFNLSQEVSQSAVATIINTTARPARTPYFTSCSNEPRGGSLRARSHLAGFTSAR